MDSGNHLLGWRSSLQWCVSCDSSSAEDLAQTYMFIPVRELLRRKYDAVLYLKKNSQILVTLYHCVNCA